MTKFGVDYFAATSPATLSTLRAHSVEFVVRYLAHPGNVKNTSKTEAGQVEKASLGLVSVWEELGDEPLHGANQGTMDARLALAEGAAAGMPPGTPIYFALDKDPNPFTPEEWAAVDAYYKAVSAEVGPHRVGAYGGYALIKHLFDRKLITYGFQTYAWSGGQWDARAQLRQYLNAQTLGGLSVDFDHAVSSDYGQWRDRSPEKPIRYYQMTYRNKKGQIQHRNTKHPVRWQIRYPRVKKHGVVEQRPVR